MTFHRERANLKGPDWFQRFRVPADGEEVPLERAGLEAATELLLFERAGAW